ncbi:dTDP-4-dehydrorhamnose 3,5-epimerase family protein [Kribbella solani]|uniref:dTDP-4-dehydrorhamnose 3,5-epimerase family protein n=1 Tax=Kribbella solani TaxID=236067 RepID=UPI0029BF1408|nr:dTDP-4-dehydrorhamnose 3,5-epimerase family protein [Kribbella solani]MDX2971724.1 dTDP-4-dehydrorhamnose 3,5-epimerase family protein [Kribbella solani]
MMIDETGIPGVLRIELEVKANPDGWFKENFHREKLASLGMDVVQHNVAYFAEPGVVRGIHAEPWDKYLSPSSGRVFVALADLRANDTFGRVETFELGTSDALFVPRGVGNSFCTLAAHTTYNFLVNEHWSPERITVDLFDPELRITWPYERARLSYTERDAANPPLAEVRTRLGSWPA